MSTLYIIRHGQASFLSDDYDRLSELGARQAAALGAWWARRGTAPTEVIVGPRLRHRQTWEAARTGYRGAGGAAHWPEPRFDEAWDEYAFGALLQADVTAMIGADPALSAMASELLRDHERRAHHFQRLFEALTLRWVRGELTIAGCEPWAAFRRRVEMAATALLDGPGGHTIAVFTSGGPVAAATAMLLRLDDVSTMELSWTVRNAAFSEIRFREDRRSLVCFGALPHLDDPDLETWR